MLHFGHTFVSSLFPQQNLFVGVVVGGGGGEPTNTKIICLSLFGETEKCVNNNAFIFNELCYKSWSVNYTLLNVLRLAYLNYWTFSLCPNLSDELDSHTARLARSDGVDTRLWRLQWCLWLRKLSSAQSSESPPWQNCQKL